MKVFIYWPFIIVYVYKRVLNTCSMILGAVDLTLQLSELPVREWVALGESNVEVVWHHPTAIILAIYCCIGSF